MANIKTLLILMTATFTGDLLSGVTYEMKESMATTMAAKGLGEIVKKNTITDGFGNRHEVAGTPDKYSPKLKESEVIGYSKEQLKAQADKEAVRKKEAEARLVRLEKADAESAKIAAAMGINLEA